MILVTTKRTGWKPICWAALVAGCCLPAAAGEAEKPIPDGLVFWVDASQVDSLRMNDSGKVARWSDLSGRDNHLYAEREQRPTAVRDGMNGRPVVRFSGAQKMAMKRFVREAPGGGVVLIVWQRSANQASDVGWQRALASIAEKTADNKRPNFCMVADRNGSGAAVDPVIYDLEITDAPIARLIVGGNDGSDWQCLRGDIAEILIYDRMFLSEGELQQVTGYLRTKWNAKVGREERGWTRLGELGPVPEHARQDRPLSDQENKAGWTLDSRLSDEFDGAELDADRWETYPTDPPTWKGRQPALFDKANVSVQDGMLHLVFRKGDTPELRKYKKEGYADYTSALVRTRERSGYGYYEARCRPMNSAGSSAFWLIGTGLPDHNVEIDIFEIGGNAVGLDRKYNMNAHVTKTPTEKRHWSVGGVWNAPWRLADAFHVYGFEWNADEMTWYVDGVAVRRMKNTNWHYPLNVLFDSESMFSWLGVPKDEDLPSTFSIDYLRVWRRAPP